MAKQVLVKSLDVRKYFKVLRDESTLEKPM